MDVTARRVIALPPQRVADYAMDWRHDHEWTQGIREAALTKPADGGGFGVGAEVTRTAYFLRKRIDYVLRVEEYRPPELLDMKSIAGPMPMHVTYRFTPHCLICSAPLAGARCDAHSLSPHADGTLASIRVRGDASGYRLAGPLMSLMVRSNLRKDLRDLQRRVAQL